MNSNEGLCTPVEASQILGVTTHTLAVWRCEKRYNLPYVKVGRLVRYRRSDITDFIERCLWAEPAACGFQA
ncbi:helix-turn-helix domain-containing protein [Alloalcanivorax venustensis]|uniref:helix-turn-helix domain-containing protein n=1 Tax=Alloalcanivorax venustensis TaxID=172371 RepID=UPI00351591CB